MLLDERINLAHAAVQREDWDKAWLILRDALNEDCDHPAGLYLVGVILRQQGHIGTAVQVFRRTLALVPQKVNVWMHYAACLHDLNKYEEAREAFLHVHRNNNKDPMPIANIASGYTQLGRNREAIEWADKALTLEPDNRIARIAKGFSSLSLGRWSEGWQYLKDLYGDTLEVRIYTPDGEPEWDGEPDKTVVVQCEQGVGDQIMFSQCLLDMKKSADIIVECAPRMVGYFERNFGVKAYGTLKQKYADWPAKHKIDAHTHISFLGKWFRTKDEDFPRRVYISPDPERLEKWKQWLSAFPKPWVGLSWKGGIPQTNMQTRSVRVEDYAPIMEMPGTFFDMSYDPSGLEVARWNIDHATQIVKPPIDTTDYEDTIALTAAFDDVVTVTTTLAHVCGALGRHAYVLVPEAPQWRYAHRIDDGLGVIWYPKNSIALYRQAHGESGFENTIKRIARDMKNVNQLRAA